ncbi:cytochrome bd biosynthesis protein [Levilactobacillus zymae]|uniref:Cytochrome bd biosynthesis protein n=1 Tax=Levilactobacillus zymae TaxID=267363 RepID=A0ABQ0WYW5_9LACO|nr:ATP-binding cassette domain-containing protein [Levilactobacillus zymae]KRL16622.1 cytochrome bd biosynthesis ABC-type transporter, ATPase and permease component [Levilactobacillus zymae DSM 19395]QFR60579.1 ATP-binding cassette domain-containing protein [Levilactobacillus zymae]GEO72728.1 cytochrome bd biosynthesis protein [Levilactobacillus zymae]
MIKRLWQLGAAQRWKMEVQLVGQWLSRLLVVTLVWAGAQWALRGTVNAVLLGLIGLQLVVTVLYLVASRWLSRNGWAAAASQDLQRQFLNATFRPTQATTNVMQGLQQDLSTLRAVTIFFDTVIPTILQLILTGLVLLGVVLWAHAWTVVIPVGGILLLGMGMGLLQGLGNRQNLAYIQSFNRMGQRFLDDFLGMSTLIMYQRQHRYAQDFATDSEDYRQKTMGVLRYQLQSLTIMDFCLYGAIGYFLLAQVNAVQAHTLALSTALGIGTLTAVWLIDFRQFGYFMHVFMSTLPKLRHLFAVIDAAAVPQTGTAVVTLDAPVTRLQLTGTVGHTDQSLLTTDLTLTAGQLVGLTGPSGSGKSTLAQTLMQRQPLLAGQILVNGTTDLAAVAPTDWLKHFAYLGPTAKIFAGSIQDNLLLGNQAIDWQQRLTDLGLCHFVVDLPAGYATQVGENGAQLSPGQRQQVAVARAVLANKDGYLFDEVTSNIDPTNANQILSVIQQLAQTKLVLLITHRLDDLNRLDRLLFLTDHQLISGTFTSLQTQVPAFAQLVQEQQRLLKEVATV